MLDDSQAQGQQSVKSKVQAKCCFALETFCENLGDEIVPFLEPLMARLCALLRAAPRDTQEICVSAIASVALASEARFTPFFAPTYELMRTLLQQTGDAELKLRSRAMECVGHMIEAVGREQCEDAVRESGVCAQWAPAWLPELREYTFGSSRSWRRDRR